MASTRGSRLGVRVVLPLAGWTCVWSRTVESASAEDVCLDDALIDDDPVAVVAAFEHVAPVAVQE